MIGDAAEPQIDAKAERRAKHAAHQRAYAARNKEKLNAAQKARYEANKERLRSMRIAKKYGLVIGQFEEMLAAQEGRCLCCKTLFGLLKAHRPFVDHCHQTGKVRGLLCNQCNAVLGHAHDSPEVLRRCAAYLESSK